jgi:hypothetical protein
MTESTLEPAGVGPVAGGHLRASDRDREQVSTVLSAAYAEGRLTREEHDERLDALLAAKTFDDLVGLTRDLVDLPAPTQPATPAVAGPRVDTVAASGETDRMVAIFSGAERKGTWRVRRRIESYALFGGIDLDMREATFESPVTEINGFWCFGGLDIKVPAGVEVRDQTMGIFGGSDVKNVGEAAPGAPVLVIKGMAVFGGVSVKGPRPARRWGANPALGRRSSDHGRHH